MKNYEVTVLYDWEGYNGYDKSGSETFTIMARNEKSALNKAKKKIPFYADVRSTIIYERACSDKR